MKIEDVKTEMVVETDQGKGVVEYIDDKAVLVRMERGHLYEFDTTAIVPVLSDWHLPKTGRFSEVFERGSFGYKVEIYQKLCLCEGCINAILNGDEYLTRYSSIEHIMDESMCLWEEARQMGMTQA